jgi:hypothetical protein
MARTACWFLWPHQAHGVGDDCRGRRGAQGLGALQRPPPGGSGVLRPAFSSWRGACCPAPPGGWPARRGSRADVPAPGRPGRRPSAPDRRRGASRRAAQGLGERELRLHVQARALLDRVEGPMAEPMSPAASRPGRREAAASARAGYSSSSARRRGPPRRSGPPGAGRGCAGTSAGPDSSARAPRARRLAALLEERRALAAGSLTKLESSSARSATAAPRRQPRTGSRARAGRPERFGAAGAGGGSGSAGASPATAALSSYSDPAGARRGVAASESVSPLSYALSLAFNLPPPPALPAAVPDSRRTGPRLS